MRYLKRIIITSIVALAAACSSSTAPPTLSVAGEWTGTVGTQAIAMTLVETAGTVNGSGTISNTPTGTRALTISGAFSAPTISATISSGIVAPIALKATLSGSTLSGTLTGSGFDGNAITFTRK